jgi:putative phosphoribosyl transferase
VGRVKETIRQRSLFYRGDRELPSVQGRLVVIVDDGLASGYTMLAAIESLKRRHAGPVIAAVPVAAASAVDQVKRRAHCVVTCFTGFVDKFYIADYYRYWHDLSDDEGRQCFREWRRRRDLTAPNT